MKGSVLVVGLPAAAGCETGEVPLHDGEDVGIERLGEVLDRTLARSGPPAC